MIYNIVWADDEIATLCNSIQQKIFEMNDINVVEMFENANDLLRYLDNPKERVDAVVIDANFPDSTFEANNERDISGMQRILLQKAKYKDKFPFILYTGRLELMSENDKIAWFREFDNMTVIKGTEGTKHLIKKIKEVVDAQRKPEQLIEQVHGKAIKCFETFDTLNGTKEESKALIMKILTMAYSGTMNDAATYLWQIRCLILEKMNSLAAKYGIVPPKLATNEFSYFLCGRNSKFTINCNEIMPLTLSGPLEYVVRLTQDGAHSENQGEGKLAYHVLDYLKRNDDSYLVLSVCFATMEIMTWFMTYLCEHTDKKENQKKWSKRKAEEG